MDTITSDHEKSLIKLGMALGLTIVFVLVEIVGGFLTNSLALLADAGHMIQDTIALMIATAAVLIAQRPKTPVFTFGYRRIEVVAAFTNALLLLVVGIVVFFEATQRLGQEIEVNAGPMLVVAIIGLLINLVVLIMMMDTRMNSINLRGAFLHVLSDAMGSLGAIIASILILTTGQMWWDPVASFFIAGMILLAGFRLIR